MADESAESLYSLAVRLFGDLSGLYSDMDRAKGEAVTRGGQVGQSFGESLKRQLTGQLAGGGIAGQIFGGSVQGAAGVGLGRIILGAGAAASSAGAQIRYYRDQLRELTTDAKTADDALGKLQTTANDSNFDTDQVMQLGMVIAGRSGNVGQAATQTQQVTDAAATLGIRNQNFNAFQTNLGQILAKQKGKLDAEDVRQLRTYAPTIAVQIAKATGTTVDKANALLDTGTGKQLFDAILKIGETNKGAAKGQSSADPAAAMANLTDSINNGLAPSGERLNAVLTPMIGLLKESADKAGELNKATGGSAGLAIALGLTSIAVIGMVNGARGAIAGVTTLTGAINDLAAASLRATIAAEAGTGAENTKAASDVARGVGVAVGGAGAVAGTAATAGKVVTGTSAAARLASAAKGAAPTILPMVATAAGGAMQQDKDPKHAGIRALGKGLEYTGIGAGIGSIVGMVAGGIIGSTLMPGVGTAGGIAAGNRIGAMVGGGIGFGTAVVQSAISGGEEKDKKPNDAADKLAKAADKLSDAGDILKVGGKQFGGGARTQYQMGVLEREYVALHLSRAGTMGIG